MTAQKAQYAKLKPELDQAFSTMMASMELQDGPQVKSLARALEDYLQVAHALPCAHGTDALLLALAALDLPAGGEVILPAFCDRFVAEAVAASGLQPMFADVLPDTFTIDPVAVSSLVTPGTVAVIAVHLFGQCADLAELLQLAKRHQFYVIEDSAQSFGASYTMPDNTTYRAGALADIAITSFYPPKPLAGMDDGGAVLTNQPAWARKAEELLRKGGPNNSQTGALSRPAPIAALDAALLEVKIKYISDYKQARQQVAAVYDQLFEKCGLCQVPVRNSRSTHIFQQYVLKVPGHLRDALQQHLQQHYIPSTVYYPQPLHLQNEFQLSYQYKKGDLPVAEEVAASVLSLPMHTELTEEQQGYIAYHTISFLQEHG